MLLLLLLLLLLLSLLLFFFLLLLFALACKGLNHVQVEKKKKKEKPNTSICWKSCDRRRLNLYKTKANKSENEQWIALSCWLRSVPATCLCISGMDLLRHLYVLPHWDKSCSQTFFLTQSRYIVTVVGPTSPSADPISITTAPGMFATGVPNFKSLVKLDPEKSPLHEWESRRWLFRDERFGD